MRRKMLCACPSARAMSCGVQMAYLKQWAPRASKELALRMPDVVDGEGIALGVDAGQALAIEFDRPAPRLPGAADHDRAGIRILGWIGIDHDIAAIKCPGRHHDRRQQALGYPGQ